MAGYTSSTGRSSIPSCSNLCTSWSARWVLIVDWTPANISSVSMSCNNSHKLNIHFSKPSTRLDKHCKRTTGSKKRCCACNEWFIIITMLTSPARTAQVDARSNSPVSYCSSYDQTKARFAANSAPYRCWQGGLMVFQFLSEYLKPFFLQWHFVVNVVALLMLSTKSQGSVAKCFRCGGTFGYNKFTAKSSLKEF